MTVYVFDDPSTLYDTATYDSAADGALFVELLLNGVWTNVTSYVRVEQAVRITRGRQDEQSAPVPATCSLTFDNSDGRFTPSYTAGAYYPYVARNTQLRVSVFQTGVSYVRFWGEVSEWPIQYDYTARNVTVDVVAGGYRRRLQRAAVPHNSVYKLAELALTPMVGYWPMEDADGATSFASALSGGVPMSFAGGGTLANDSSFVCSDPLPSFLTTGTAAAVVPVYVPSVAGQQVRMLSKLAGTTGEWQVYVSTSGGHYFKIGVDLAPPPTGQINFYMFNTATGVLEYTSSGIGLLTAFSGGCRVSMSLVQNGTGIDVHVEYLAVGQTIAYNIPLVTVPSATLGRVTGVRFASTGDVTSVVGHLSVENQVTSAYDLLAVLNAYAGETASARASRIAAANGWTTTVTTGTVSTLLGAQTTDNSLALFDDTAYVDGGLSTELVTTLGLQWRGRSAMYDLTSAPVLPLTRLTGITQTTDDQATENDVTVNRVGGASSRAVATSGLTPAAVGTYAAGYDLNLYTDLQTLDHANWRMSIGSLDKPRYPSIQFDAISGFTSALRDDLIAMREGFAVGLTATASTALGLPASSTLRVAGWTETITDAQWLFDVCLTPGDIYENVFVLDSATLGVLDSNRLGL